ncbi:hypothetical protein [Altibacter sp. HG106]|uniref:hypothetical protein n=1 Tax=Altibacter sp. HG106 TaxID=3023937 RepID=UPI002350AF0D|nr:hypothetical protein [Altibacter sp. HG106]MDC7996319.1 hypothetical protein [Altibacter sp. HG106]
MRVFSEVQRFNQWWFYLIIFSVAASVYIPLFLFGTEERSLPTEAFWITVGSVLFVTVLFLWMVFVLRLKTTINEQGIQYQFKGFHRAPKEIDWRDLDQAYVRTYRPLSEYGGWGIRGSLGTSNKAYNVRGNKGLQLVFKNGNRILIGTQQPEILKKVLTTYHSKIVSHEH